MTAPIDRRLLLKTGAFGLGALSLPGGAMAAMQAALTKGFSHGVASGEPSQNSILLWTRFVSDLAETRLKAEISETATFRKSSRGRSRRYAGSRLYCQNHPARPEAGRAYYYRFVAPDGSISPSGAHERCRPKVSSGTGWHHHCP